MSLASSADRQQIVMTLRREIIEGRYKPGGRLPTRIELRERFDASPITIQRVMDQLAKEGFIEVRRRKSGTVVVKHPPHLNYYRFLIPLPNDHPLMGSPFVRAVQQESTRLERLRTGMMCSFCNLSDALQPEDTRRLIEDVLSERVAGLLFLFNPIPFNTPILKEPRVPRVVLAPETQLHNVPHIWFDEKVIEKAVERFAQLGCRRVAMLCAYGWDETQAKLFRDSVAAYGMATRPHWMQAVNWTYPEAVRNCVHLLMHPGQAERPDALLIIDDSLVSPAGDGLLAAGIVPNAAVREIQVIAHANFPRTTPTRFPMIRIGFNIRELVSRGIDCIDAQRRGETVQHLTLLPTLFENEL